AYVLRQSAPRFFRLDAIDVLHPLSETLFSAYPSVTDCCKNFLSFRRNLRACARDSRSDVIENRRSGELACLFNGGIKSFEHSMGFFRPFVEARECAFECRDRRLAHAKLDLQILHILKGLSEMPPEQPNASRCRSCRTANPGNSSTERRQKPAET